MEGLDFGTIYKNIGDVLGTPTAIAFFLLWYKQKEMDKRLNGGESRFARIEQELREYNGMLRELIGMFKMSIRAKDHTPEE